MGQYQERRCLWPFLQDHIDYASTPLANGDVDPNAPFTLHETFGYSLNGKQFMVAQGGSYTDVLDNSPFVAGTKASILAGVNGSALKTIDGRTTTKAVNTGWTEKPTASNLHSDILSLWGMTDINQSTTDKYTLSLGINAVDFGSAFLGQLGLSTQDANGNWVLASGDASSFKGTFNSSTDYPLGSYGYNIDGSAFSVWTVVNKDGNFAVTAVPEPATAGLLMLGGVATLLRRRRKA